MRFDVLGPLRVRLDDGETWRPGGKSAELLATLLSEPGLTVTVDRLVDALWGDEGSPSAARTLRWHVHQLRRRIGADRIESVASGYRLDPTVDELDSRRFETLLAEARDRDDPAARDALAEALALWRGDAFTQLDDRGPVRAAAGRLNQLRLEALERYGELCLRTDRHAEIIPEWTNLVERFPTREAFAAQLMLAHWYCGRPAEALAVHRTVRDRLADRYGMDPGTRLRELERAVLTGRLGPAPDTARSAEPGEPAVAVVPAELPAVPVGFVGRDAELDRLAAALTGAGDGPRIVAISGMGGIGKSALAARLAHRVAEHFPDGQLYVDLHGNTPELKPVEPAEALGRLLRSLGVSTERLLDEAEFAARFRTATARRRLLVVMDDARDVNQVRPLLPSGPDCAVVVGSRQRLATLPAATRIELPALDDDQARALLTRRLGAARSAAEPEATDRLIARCAGLPLALEICAARLIARPGWTVSTLESRLADEHGRLAELAVDDLAVRTCFEVGYRELLGDPDGSGAARMFRLLGVHDGPDIGLLAAAALADVDRVTAERQLEALCRVRLVEEHRPGRYRSHDLLRWYARELVDTEDTVEDRARAVRRVLFHYCAMARAAMTAINPQANGPLRVGPTVSDPAASTLADRGAAVAWMRAEFHAVSAVLRGCPPDRDLAGAAAATALAIVSVSQDFRGDAELRELMTNLLEPIEATGDPGPLSALYGWIGNLSVKLLRFDEAQHWLERAVTTAEQAERPRVSGPLGSLAVLARRRGDLDAAMELAHRCLVAGLAEDAPVNVARAMLLLGRALALRGDTAAALDWLDRCVASSAGVNDGNASAALGAITDIHLTTGDLDAASDALRRAIELDIAGDRVGTTLHAGNQWRSGVLAHATGDLVAAREHWSTAARILRELGQITEEEHRRILTAEVPTCPEALR